MIEDIDIDEREYHFDLTNLDSKRNNDYAFILAHISIAAALAILGISLNNSFGKYLAIVSSLFFSLSAVERTNKTRQENQKEKDRIYKKFISQHRSQNKDNKLKKEEEIVHSKSTQKLIDMIESEKKFQNILFKIFIKVLLLVTTTASGLFIATSIQVIPYLIDGPNQTLLYGASILLIITVIFAINDEIFRSWANPESKYITEILKLVIQNNERLSNIERVIEEDD